MHIVSNPPCITYRYCPLLGLYAWTLLCHQSRKCERLERFSCAMLVHSCHCIPQARSQLGVRGVAAVAWLHCSGHVFLAWSPRLATTVHRPFGALCGRRGRGALHSGGALVASICSSPSIHPLVVHHPSSHPSPL